MKARPDPKPETTFGAPNVQECPAPQPGRRAVSCTRCRAWYLDTDPGRKAHMIVFGHQPRAEEQTS